MTNAYTGKLLRINLSESNLKEENLDLEKAKKFIGARGLGSKMLMEEIDPKVDPLSPENKLILMTGPITGTNAPTSGRYVAVTKSPLTNMIACSNSGGHWGPKLKFSGYDGIIIEGKSETPVYLLIDGNENKILSAKELWGKTSLETEKILKELYPDSSILNIGPAGEKLSLISAIINDGDRAAGRSGVGAVLGSKNLKAIVVSHKSRKLDLHSPEKFREELIVAMKKIKDNGVTGQGLPAYGTAVLVNIINEIGSLPTNNWKKSQFDRAENISGETLREKYLVKQGYCFGCPIGCGRVINLDGKIVGGPEYEPLWAYGANCGIDDLKAIDEANFWCNELGLDAISTPCTIAAAMELYEKGLISDNDCEGVPLKFGSSQAIIFWTKKIGLQEGKLGSLMAQGSQRLCEYYNHPEISMSVKKQELPAYDARGIQGIGLNYATSNRGGCHVRGYMISPEVLSLPIPLDRNSIEGKAQWTKIFQDLTAVIDSMGMCLFSSFALGTEDYANFLNSAIGTNYSQDELLEIGERIYNLERVFNQKAGMKPEEDTLPKRLLEDPIENGPSKGAISHLYVMLPEYYKARGWVEAFPTKETLERLELDEL